MPIYSTPCVWDQIGVPTSSAGSKTDRISIRYVPPEDPTYQWIYTELKQRGALEKLQTLLSPFRLPRTLDVSLDECGGDPDAFYDYSAITICYEFIHPHVDLELAKELSEKTWLQGPEQ